MGHIGYIRILCLSMFLGNYLFSEDVLKVHGNTRIEGDFIPKTSLQFQVAGDIPAFQGTPPSWWTSLGVIQPEKLPNDSAAVTQGQLKYMTQRAIQEMNLKLTEGAGTKLTALLSSWNTLNSNRNDYSAVNIGQIKAVAKLFYNRLNAVGANISYPWTVSITDDSDYSAANLGQLKKAFSFTVPNGGSVLQDTDEDGLPDVWELEKFENLNQNEFDDYDQDGISNQMEYWTGSDPSDPYNGLAPVLTKLDGDNQKDDAGTVLNRTFKVKVTNSSGVPVVNVPVRFSVNGGYSSLVLNRSLMAASASQVTLRTNSEGIVQSYIRLPEETSNLVVEVEALSNVLGNTITFNATSLNFIGAVSAGASHCLGLRQNGTLYAWGNNLYGQLGSSNSEVYYNPLPVPLSNVRQIAVGQYHSVALQSDGTVFTFGANWSFQIGNGAEQWQNQITPLQVLTGVRSIAAGDGYTLALKQDGTVWYWGTIQFNDNVTNQTIEIKSIVPTQVTGLSDIISIAAGANHILALKSDGSIWSWGQNSFGQLGNGNQIFQSVPSLVSTISGATRIFSGGNQSFAQLEDGKLMAWGDNSFGQIPGISGNFISTPTELVAFPENYKISSGYGNTFILQADQLIQSVGYNNSGQLGRRDVVQQMILGSINGSTPTRQISTKGDTVLSLMEDGTIWVWGATSSGQSTKEFLKQVAYPYQINLTTKENVILADTDGDGLSDRQEVFAGTNINLVDTDGDSLRDGQEFQYSSDPLKQDTDNDGLMDGQEVNTYLTNPALNDTDGDFLGDKFEVDYSFNPLVANNPNADSDGDGMTDWYEFRNNLNPRTNDAGLDLDGDTLTNLQEFQNYSLARLKDSDHDGLEDGVEFSMGTRLDYWDSDGDKLSDGYEVIHGLNPLVANDTTSDADGDGLTLIEEQKSGTNPNSADTDGDGASDRVEIRQGSNPRRSSDGGQAPPPGGTVSASFFISSEGKSVNPSCATCHKLEFTVDGASYGSGSSVPLAKGETYSLGSQDTPDDTSRGEPNPENPPSIDNATFTFQPGDSKIGTASGGDIYDAGSWFYLLEGGAELFKKNVKWDDAYLSQTATIKVPKIEIGRKNDGGGSYKKIDNVNSKILAGEQINLKLVVEPESINIDELVTNVKWTVVGGRLFKKFTASDSAGIVDKNISFSNNELIFYCSSESSLDIECNFKVKSRDYKVNTRLQILKPTLSNVFTQKGFNALTFNDIVMHGVVDENGSHGVVFKAKWQLPEGFSEGSICAIQKVFEGEKMISNGESYRRKYYGQWALDNVFPYGDIYSSSSQVFENDTPSSPYEGNSMTDASRYQFYWMFKPSGSNSQWIPLRAYAWGKSYSIYKDIDGVWKFALKEDGSRLNDSTFLSQGVLVDDHPEWSVVLRNADNEWIKE